MNLAYINTFLLHLQCLRQLFISFVKKHKHLQNSQYSYKEGKLPGGRHFQAPLIIYVICSSHPVMASTGKANVFVTVLSPFFDSDISYIKAEYMQM